MFGKKKRNRVTMYGVFNSDNIQSPSNLLCIVANENEAYEYITRKTYLDNEAHYKMWCSVHNKDENTSFEEYITTVLALDENYKFFVVKLYYTKEELASIVRCMIGYELTNASFELDSEREFNDVMNSQSQEEIDSDDDIIMNNKVC